MENEYQLSFTAKEIDEKLGKIDDLSDLTQCVKIWKSGEQYKKGDWCYHTEDFTNWDSESAVGRMSAFWKCAEDHTSTDFASDYKKTYWSSAIKKVRAESSLEDSKLNIIHETYANAIKGYASGSVIVVNDVSPIEHSTNCSVAAKNLLDPYSYNQIESVGVSIDNDGVINVSAVSDEIEGTRDGVVIYDINLAKIGITGRVGARFEFDNGDENSGNTSTFRLFRDEKETTTSPVVDEYGVTSLKGSFKGAQTLRIEYKPYPATSGWIKIQIEKLEENNTIATSYTPYIADLTTVKVKRYGKNLLPSDFSNFSKWELINGDKRFYFNDLIVGQTYTLSLKRLKTLNNYGFFRFYKFKNGTQETLGTFSWGHTAGLASSSISFTVESECEYYVYGLFTGSQGMLENGVFVGLGDFQLELGDKKTPYEPYIEPTTHTANADGVVEGVMPILPSMTLVSSNDGVLINYNYNADTKAYIDNKFAELQALILEG